MDELWQRHAIIWRLFTPSIDAAATRPTLVLLVDEVDLRIIFAFFSSGICVHFVLSSPRRGGQARPVIDLLPSASSVPLTLLPILVLTHAVFLTIAIIDALRLEIL